MSADASTATDVTISPARDRADLLRVRALFRAYATAIGLDLADRSLEADLADLPGRYGPPRGTLLLARDRAAVVVGGVGVSPHAAEGACELTRLYVLPGGRGTGAGRALAQAALAFAARAGYREMRLDTLPKMATAAALYRALGFAPIPAPADDAGPGRIYFSKVLA